ncbi:GNAT family N-acetyltransferase [Winogradskya humida]|uniref:N-acetyltransferase domain-containing protein n=1 Tax=Winogradskya humida TaxID=113566 RepID=A0ABQ4A4D5_9ACTN|nr:GNAT family N-acetyltransferase [Actinoplanes humidus]GIE25701.1 hypothetical protein Ahu01nite_088030 [Actinoplanes humidus]
MQTPDLRVDELRIRPWHLDDADAMVRACQDPERHRWSPELPWPYGKEHAEGFIREHDGLHLAIFDEHDLVGSVALHSIDEDAGTAEIGYWSAPWARGRRVTERAGRALLRWAFDEGLTRIDWKSRIGNHASRLPALRMGFTIIGIRPGDKKRPAQWVGALTETGLTAAGTEVASSVRRTARAFHAGHPVIKAGPVTLRKPAEKDILSVTRTFNDPEVVRWFAPPQPYHESHGRRYVTVRVDEWWASGAEAVFAIADHLDAYTGSIDLRVSDNDPAVGEVGYFVAPWARGRGYAVAATRAISRWGFEELGLERIQLRWEAGNELSGKVSAGSGFTTEGSLRQALKINGTRRDCWVASRLREEAV